MGGLSIWHWLILLVVVLAIFGTKKIKDIGPDLGNAVRGFKEAVKDPAKKEEEAPRVADKATIDVETKEKSRV